MHSTIKYVLLLQNNPFRLNTFLIFFPVCLSFSIFMLHNKYKEVNKQNFMLFEVI